MFLGWKSVQEWMCCVLNSQLVGFSARPRDYFDVEAHWKSRNNCALIRNVDAIIRIDCFFGSVRTGLKLSFNLKLSIDPAYRFLENV